MNKLNYNLVNWKELVLYDESSSTYLRWKTEQRRGVNKQVLVKGVGEEAGYFNKDGYSRTTFNSNKYFNHRIIWILHNGEIDESLFIDHIDGDRANNSINNLRLVSRKLNNRNAGITKANTTGFNGISFNKDTGIYLATWYDLSGSLNSKVFSTRKMGDEAFRLACEYRIKMIDEMNARGAGYTDKHLYN